RTQKRNKRVHSQKQPRGAHNGAVRTVSAGGTVFQRDIMDYIRGRMDIAPGTDGREIFGMLSPREIDIVKLIADGLSNQEIADRLYISNGTVRNHISTVLEKTGLEHRTQLAVRWLKG
ncbi:MAG: response regulator transcription factor, partial [Oscillospiraceae bacterium]|nr:response regulator transcription factor [Oscillospiraceae bacterium]